MYLAFLYKLFENVYSTMRIKYTDDKNIMQSKFETWSNRVEGNCIDSKCVLNEYVEDNKPKEGALVISYVHNEDSIEAHFVRYGSEQIQTLEKVSGEWVFFGKNEIFSETDKFVF